MSIVVDEEEPLVDEDDPPFEPRNVTIRTDRWVTKDFKILDFLGRGKFGEVKRCRENTSSREFAAKFICAPRPQDKKDVEHEVKVMMKLQHKRLLQLYDAFQYKDDMCLVLEIILGGELFDRVILDDFILTERACMAFMRQICEGVDYMVSKNIIHLDLKPENILCLTRTGNRIKIIDFGLAREYDPKGELRVLFGTPEFMAPEVVQFDPIDFSTDMWSVGVICYVLLSGLSPFMGDNDGETLANVTKGAYDFDYAEFEDISEDAKDLIRKLLVKDGKKRLTASQCLEHPWLRRKSPFERQLQLSKKRLKKFVYRRKWQKIVNAIIALKRMGVQLRSISDASKTNIHTPESLFGWETTATVGPGHDHPDPPRHKLANETVNQTQQTNAHGHVPPSTSRDKNKGKPSSDVTKDKDVTKDNDVSKKKAPEIVIKDTTSEVKATTSKTDICEKRSPSPRPFNKDSIKRANRWGKDKEDKTVELPNLSKKHFEKKKGAVEIPAFLKKAEKDLPDLSKKKTKQPDELPDLSKKRHKDPPNVSTEKKELPDLSKKSEEGLPDLSKPKFQNEVPDQSRKKTFDKNDQKSTASNVTLNKAGHDLPDLSMRKSPEKRSKFLNKLDETPDGGVTHLRDNTKTSPDKRIASPDKKADTKPPQSPDKKRNKDKTGGSRTPSYSPEKKFDLGKKLPDKITPSPEKKLKPWERKQEQTSGDKTSPDKILKPWEKKSETTLDKTSPEKKIKPWERKQEQPVDGKKTSPEKSVKPWEKKQEKTAESKISPEKSVKPWERKQEQPVDGKTSPEKSVKPWEKKQEKTAESKISPEKSVKPWERKQEQPADNKKSPDKSLKPWEKTQDKQVDHKTSPEKALKPWEKKQEHPGDSKRSPEKSLKPWEKRQEQTNDHKTSPEKKLKPWEKKQDSPQEKSPEKKILHWQKQGGSPEKAVGSENTPGSKIKPWQCKSEAGLAHNEGSDIEKKLPQWQRKSDVGLFQTPQDNPGEKNKNQEPQRKLKPWEKKKDDIETEGNMKPWQKKKSSQSPSPSKSPEKQSASQRANPWEKTAMGGDSSMSGEVVGVISNVVWQAEPVITVVNDIIPTVSCEHEVTAACVVLKPSK